MAKQILGQRPQKSDDEDEQQKPLFDRDTPQSAYDDEFGKILERGQLGKAPDKKSLSPKELGGAEQEPSRNSGPSVSKKEAGFFKDSDDESSEGSSPMDKLKGMANKRNAAVGGGIGGLVLAIIFLMFSFSALEAVHVKENMVGENGNGLVNRAVEKRRQRSFTRMMKRFANTDDFANAINTKKMASRFRKQGFLVDFDNNNKRLVSIKREVLDKDGNKQVIELNLNDPEGTRHASRELFNHPDYGPEIQKAYDDATHGLAQTLRGKAARRLYGFKLKTRFSSWLNERRDKNKTKREQLTEDGRKVDAADASLTKRQRRAAFGSDAVDEDGDGTLSPTERKNTSGREPPLVGEKLGKVEDDSQDSADPADKDGKLKNEEAVNQAKAGVGPIDDVLESDTKYEGDGLLGPNYKFKKTTSKVAEGLTENFNKLLTKDLTPGKFREFATKMATENPDVAGRLKGIGTAMKPLAIPRIACRVKGTVNFIDNIKSVYLALALAKFATRFLTAADDQKAGIIQSEGMDLMMTWLHTPSPVSGKSYSQAGGFQNVIMGKKDAKPNTANKGKYSVGRRQGIFGTMYNFADKIPFSKPNNCKTLNNGFLQAGEAVVGLAAAIFSGGTITSGQVAIGLGMNLIQEALFSIGESLAIRMVTGTIIDWTENGEQAGDALASGWGALRGMNAGVNGLKPITNAKAVALEVDVKKAHEYDMSQESIFARYFDITNTDSFATNLAFAISANSNARPVTVLANGFNVLNPAKFAASFFGIVPNLAPKVSAQASDPNVYAGNPTPEEEPSECTDPEVVKLDVKADVFCNIEVADAPDIDDDNSFDLMRSYVADEGEHEGEKRPLINEEGRAINYPQENGKNTPRTDFHDFIALCHNARANLLYSDLVKDDGTSSTEDKTCFENGRALSGDAAGIGRFQRFSEWYAYKLDEDNFIEDINEDYNAIDNIEPADAETNDQGGKHYFTSDPCADPLNRLPECIGITPTNSGAPATLNDTDSLLEELSSLSGDDLLEPANTTVAKSDTPSFGPQCSNSFASSKNLSVYIDPSKNCSINKRWQYSLARV